MASAIFICFPYGYFDGHPSHVISSVNILAYIYFPRAEALSQGGPYILAGECSATEVHPQPSSCATGLCYEAYAGFKLLVLLPQCCITRMPPCLVVCIFLFFIF